MGSPPLYHNTLYTNFQLSDGVAMGTHNEVLETLRLESNINFYMIVRSGESVLLPQ